MSDEIEAYAAEWFAEKSRDENRCPILLAVEALSVCVAGYSIPGVEHVIIGKPRETE